MPMPVRPGSSSRTSLRWPASFIAAIVVHRWPSQPTYCRGSSHMGQRSGGCSLSAYSTPQVTQM